MGRGTKDSADQEANSSNSNSPASKKSSRSTDLTKKKLPTTGERSSYVWLILGLVVIGFVNYQYVLKKVKQEK